MKISSLMASAVVAAFLVPAVCMSQDAPPPGGPGGFGGPGGKAFDPLAMGLQRQAANAAKDLMAEYKNAPSDKLKEQIKAKISEAFDSYVKKQKEDLAKLEAEKAKHVDELTKSAVEGTLEARGPGQGRGGQKRQKPE